MVSGEKSLCLEFLSVLNSLCPEGPGHTVKIRVTVTVVGDKPSAGRAHYSTWRDTLEFTLSWKGELYCIAVLEERCMKGHK